jgi:16S rRNA (guanine(966)-N(2))-methyltransferase RsmD
MRIIAGTYKGFRLNAFPGNDIRPTSSKIREAIFDIISTKVLGSDFLDLFAGTGAVGIEAFSRGAKSVTFVDFDYTAISLIKNNLKKIYQNDFSQVIKNNYIQAIKLLNLEQKKFDIIFLDPPYNKNYALTSLREIDQGALAKEGAIIVVQHPIKYEIKENFKNLVCLKEKKYGKSGITIFSYQQ